jgi:hypothetical protein
MKTFDLELRVSTFGSILTWKIMLEDSTDPGKQVLDWTQGQGYVFKKLPKYIISDDALEVFASCRGIRGGNITCEVYINDKKQGDVISNVEDTKFAVKSFSI